ncbi:Conserved_hypothetical protein [Hexamita inflata]|uniref:Uncharacterized protein n=1 Tax=Hexamita inflata TaxID=28002 RepID=A0AA86UGT5_9EUKA|nr:Conserved hypothetical protein [Hexamita inflata]
MLGGKFAQTNVLTDGQAYYIAQNNQIVQYSKTFQVVRKFQPTTHFIRKIQFRLHSKSQIFVQVEKRVILYDIPTMSTVSSFELKDAFVIDFIQYKEELIVTTSAKKYLVVRLPIKPQLNEISLEAPIYSGKTRPLPATLIDDQLLISANTHLTTVNLQTNKSFMTVFRESITAIHFNQQLAIGFNNGIIVLLNQLPREGDFNYHNITVLDKHNNTIQTLYIQGSEVISAQLHQNCLGQWLKRDQYFNFISVPTFQNQPLQIQLVDNLWFVHTNNNSITVYNGQFKILSQILSIPNSEHTKIKLKNDIVFVPASTGVLMQTDTKMKGLFLNMTNRDIVRAHNSTSENKIVSFDSCLTVIVALTHCIDYSLIIQKGQQVIYNLYNVIPQGLKVKTVVFDQKVVIFVTCAFGFKVYILQQDILTYHSFHKFVGIQDVDLQVKLYENQLIANCVDKTNLVKFTFDNELTLINSETIQVTKEPEDLKVYSCYNEVVVQQNNKITVFGQVTTDHAFEGLICSNQNKIFGLKDSKIYQVSQELTPIELPIDLGTVVGPRNAFLNQEEE